MATYDCPSNPSPSPASPCLDPNAHSLALSVPTVITPFTVTVQATHDLKDWSTPIQTEQIGVVDQGSDAVEVQQ